MTTDEAIQSAFAFHGDRENLPWFTMKGDREALAKLFATLGCRQGVEIGTFRGEFASLLCRVNQDLHLFCVDPWTGYHEQPSQRRMDAYHAMAVRNLTSPRITILRKTSMEALGDCADRSVDFVYIDGDHRFDAVVQDIIQWSRKVKVGGIVSGHDYQPHGGTGVMKAVDAYTQAHDIRPWYVTRELDPSFFWVNR